MTMWQCWPYYKLLLYSVTLYSDETRPMYKPRPSTIDVFLYRIKAIIHCQLEVNHVTPLILNKQTKDNFYLKYRGPPLHNYSYWLVIYIDQEIIYRLLYKWYIIHSLYLIFISIINNLFVLPSYFTIKLICNGLFYI